MLTKLGMHPKTFGTPVYRMTHPNRTAKLGKAYYTRMKSRKIKQNCFRKHNILDDEKSRFILNINRIIE